MNQGPNRRSLLAGAAAFGILPHAGYADVPRSKSWPAWRHYAGSLGATKYTPLDLINAQNVAKLGVAWTWESVDREVLNANSALRPGEFQVTPLFVEGLLITSTAMCQVAALDPKTGRAVWTYDPGTWKNGPSTTKGFLHRGVAVWGRGRQTRIIVTTGDARMIALDLFSGKPIEKFGVKGEVDLRTIGMNPPVPNDPGLYAMTSPPLVCQNTIVVGGYIDDRARGRAMPRGDVRGFDARTGALKWVFHTIPRVGEFGADTWKDGSAQTNGNTNVWAPMSADAELGLVYLPVSTPTDNFYGGRRKGNALFGESLVAVDIETGQRRWHYQLVHHGIWDYDLPAAPILADVVIDGIKRKIVAQVTKHAALFVFDRQTGEPIWPIEERSVPHSTLQDEETSLTQPFPTHPAPFDRQGISVDDLIDFTPELRAEAEQILARYEHGPMFTPPSTRPTIIMPSFVGGANWNGAAFDPETGRLYIPSVCVPLTLTLNADGSIPASAPGEGEIAGARVIARGPQGLPLMKPPYGRTTCLDMSTGDQLWMRANGRGFARAPAFARYHPQDAGSFGRSHVLLTKSLLFVGEGPQDPITAEKKLRAMDKKDGTVIAEIDLPDFMLGAPMSYVVDGEQYIVFAGGYRKWPHALYALKVMS